MWYRIAIMAALTVAALASTANAAVINVTDDLYTVRSVSAAGHAIDSLRDARRLLKGVYASDSEETDTFSVINFEDTQSSHGGHFTGDSPFPNGTDGNDQYFAVRATATVHVPEAGWYTLGVNSDDGFKLRIGDDFRMKYYRPRGAGDTFKSHHFDDAGDYELVLTYFEQRGWSNLELFASAGRHESFDDDGAAFELIGPDAGSTVGTPPLPSVDAPIPEPSCVALIALAGLLVVRRR